MSCWLSSVSMWLVCARSFCSVSSAGELLADRIQSSSASTCSAGGAVSWLDELDW